MDMQTIKAAVLRMIQTSPFVESAGLTSADVAFRFSESPEYGPAAFSLDVSNVVDSELEQLKDHVTLFGRTVLGASFQTKLTQDGDKQLLHLRIKPTPVGEVAASDEDDDDFEDDDEYMDEDEEDEEDEDFDSDLGDDADDMDEEIDNAVAEVDADPNIPATPAPAPVAQPAAPAEQQQGSLRVLTTPEMHRQVGKLYSSIGESVDMSRYVAFLQEIDNVLHRYGGVPAQPRVPTPAPNPAPGADETAAQLLIVSELAAVDADLGTVVAGVLEEARKKGKKKGGHKPGRSGLLSAIMKSLSGDDSLQTSWDNINVEKFKAALHSIADKVADKLAKFQKDKTTAETASATMLANGEIAALGESDDPEGPSNLCAMLPLLNAQDILDWAAENDFQEVCAPNELHVTVAYSREAFDWNKVRDMSPVTLPPSPDRSLAFLGDKGALVLHLAETEVAALRKRWQEYRDAGASHDFPDYLPHLTLSYKSGLTEDQLINVRPYEGQLIFGHEVRKQLSEKKGAFDVNNIEHVPVI